MVNVQNVAKSLGRLALMKFFPSDDDARKALVEMVCGMIASDDQAEWLAKRMLAIYPEWPGPHELRACFCWRYKPCDGVNAYSKIYPDELPPDPTAPPRLGIEGTQRLALPAGHVASADVECEAAVQAAVKLTPKMPVARLSNGRPLPDNRFSKVLRELTTPPHHRPDPAPTPQVITQADIDKAVAERKAKKAGGDR